MFIKKTLSTFAIIAFLTLSTSTHTLASSTDVTPDYAALEARFPKLFRGFGATKKEDFLLIEKYRNCGNVFASDPDLLPKITALKEALTLLDRPALTPLLGEVAKVLGDETQHTVIYYVALLAKTALALSVHTTQDEYFFKAAGFSRPYDLIKEAAIDDTFWDTIAGMNKKNFDTRSDYHETTNRVFFDPLNVMNDMLEAGPFSSVPFFMLCTEPGADVFGFYYLAKMYYHGIHPVPITTAGENEELHGIPMSAWAKFCHDLAHSTLNKSDYSVRCFTDNILNAYLDKLYSNLVGLTREDKELYGIDTMISHVTRFALAVHNAYHQSLIKILEASLVEMGITPEIDALPPEFKAFVTGAFIYTHENERDDLSIHYATPSLRVLLEKTTIDIEETAPNASKEDLFKTSFITGDSSLTDEEIIGIAIAQPLRTSQHKYFLPQENNFINALSVVHKTCTVKRNDVFIEVEIATISGKKHLFRERTNKSRLLNFEHDHSILNVAQVTLREKYGYDLPDIPQRADFEDDIAYVDAASAFNDMLNRGIKHLMSHFLDTATDIADVNGIFDRFSKIYTEALAELETHMPAFIGDDLQAFLTKAMPKSTRDLLPENLYGLSVFRD